LKSIIVLYLIFCLNTGAFISVKAPVKGSSSKLPGLLLKVQNNYKIQKTIEAEFEQIEFIKLTGQTKKSSGHLLIQYPDHFRWETLESQSGKSLVVSNGHKIWVYTPPFDAGEKGQVIISESQTTQSDLGKALLSGNFSKLSKYKLKPLAKAHFQFSGTAQNQIHKIEVEVDEKLLFVKKIFLEYTGGNSAQISLSQAKLGSKINPDLFNFIVPAQTEIIKP
jgi:outer membrane lipoprotein-sorting protein